MIIMGKARRRRAATDIQRCWHGMHGRRRASARRALLAKREQRARQRDPVYRTKLAFMLRAAAPIVQRWWKHVFAWRHIKFNGHAYALLDVMADVQA